MKRFILCIAFFLVLCVSVAFFMEINIKPNITASADIVHKEDKMPEEKEIPKQCAVNNAPKNAKYQIREFEGNIAIFKSGTQMPYKTTSISVNDLPQKDREILKNGIEASSEEELSTILEDYCS